MWKTEFQKDKIHKAFSWYKGRIKTDSFWEKSSWIGKFSMNIQIDKSIPAEGWIEKNLDKMMVQITRDARHQKPLPLKITMHPLALRKFIDLLKSKSAFFPNADGSFSFLKIPVYSNSRLPYGTFTVERFREVPLMVKR